MSYDHKLIDSVVNKIVEVSHLTNSQLIGPIPLPTKNEKFIILRATHNFKTSREQFERKTHKRLLFVNNPSDDTRRDLSNLNLPAGVSLEIKDVDKI